MEIRHLRYFTTLAKTLSFTQAAESLYVSQSTLSQQIAALERELGLTLFERSHRSVELTDAGRALLTEAQHILSEVDRFGSIADAQAERADKPSQLSIGFDLRVLSSDLLRNTVCDEVFRYRGEHSGVHVRFVTAESEHIEHQVQEGSLDLAFLLLQQPVPANRLGLSSRCLFEDEFVVVVRAPERIEDTPDNLRRVLTRRGVVLLENEGRGLMQAVKLFDRIAIEPTIHFSNTRDEMLLTLSCGEYAAILPRGLARALDVPGLSVLSFRRDEACLYVLAAWKPAHETPLAMQVVERVAARLHQLQ